MQGGDRICSFRGQWADPFLAGYTEGSRKARGMVGGGNFPAAQPPGKPERKRTMLSQRPGLPGFWALLPPSSPRSLAPPHCPSSREPAGGSWLQICRYKNLDFFPCSALLKTLALTHLCRSPRRPPPLPTAPGCSGSHMTLSCSQPSRGSGFPFQGPVKSEAPRMALSNC